MFLVSIPQKRRPDKHKSATVSFYNKIATAIKLHLDLERLKCIIIASPGFIRTEFLEQILAGKEENKVFTENKDKFLSVHSSSGYKHSLMEVLADESVASRLLDTKAAKETNALEKFQELLMEDPDRAFYGRKQVRKQFILEIFISKK